MIHELKRAFVKALEEEAARARDGLLNDGLRDVGDIRSRIGYWKGLVKAIEIINEIFRQNI